MDKQQQIEEMAKIIDDRLIEARGYLGSMNKGEGYWIAQKLIEHYQTKLPEGAVIVSKQVWEEHIKNWDKTTKAVEERVRKETAEKFAKSIKAKFAEISTCGLVEEHISVLNGYINKTAKEITENKV